MTSVTSPAPSRNAVADLIADRFISALRNGTVPWQKPWTAVSPSNGATRKAYRGINAFLLGLLGTDDFYLTFNQAKGLGGFVNKGSKGFPVVFYKPVEKQDKATGEAKRSMLLRYYTVFAVKDCTLPAFDRPARLTFEPVGVAEALATLNPCPVSHGGARAFYRPSAHSITLPVKESFTSVANYYAVLFHEVGHSLMPVEQRNSVSPFGSSEYAKEELVAELFSALCLNHCNLLGAVNFDNSTAYLGSWLKALENNPSLIISASNEAWRRFEALTGAGKAEETEEGEG